MESNFISKYPSKRFNGNKLSRDLLQNSRIKSNYPRKSYPELDESKQILYYKIMKN